MSNWSEVLLEIAQVTFLFTWGIILGILQFLVPRRPKSLKDEVILVTGGSTGIGREILLQLANVEQDLTLISWDIDSVSNDALMDGLKSLGVRKALSYKVDVTDREKVIEAAAKIREDVGDVTMIFNNAGIMGPVGRSWDADINFGKKTFEVNLFSHWYILREFFPTMMSKNKGHVIGICSIAGFIWCPDWATYASSKHAVKAYYEGLKEDLRFSSPNSEVKITLVYPGLIATNMTKPFKLEKKPSFMSLPPPAPATDAAAKIVEGVLRNEEHIYFPGYWRIFHTFMSFLPAESLRRSGDILGFDPLGRRTAPKSSQKG